MSARIGPAFEQEILTSESKIPTSLKVFFCFIQMCFGMNFGFFDFLSEKLRTAAIFISLVMTLTTTYIMLSPLIFSIFNVWYLICLLQYLFIILILYISKYNLHNFIKNVSAIIKDVPEIRSEFFGVLTIAYTLFIFLVKYAVSLLKCLYAQDDWCLETQIYYLPYYIYSPFVLSCDLISVVFILIYYYIYCYVKKINSLIHTSQFETKVFQKYYLSLADCYDKIIPLYDKLIIVELGFEFPKLLTMVWYMLYYIKNKANWISYVIEGVYSLHIMIRVLLPCIITEITAAKVEAIKLALYYKMLYEEDMKKNNEIVRLLRYMEVRRLQHKVWRVIPVDLQLPLTVFSMCITYIIVIVQFTHLYD